LQQQQEEEEAGDEDEEVVPSSEQGSERTKRLWVRGPASLPTPPKTEAEKWRLKPTKKE
jgi:hypothetical protein